MATGNEYRKVRALLAKTTAAGCTEGEAVSALETALRLIVQYGLDRNKLEITVPDGYAIKGSALVKMAEVAKDAADKAKAKTAEEKAAKAAARAKDKADAAEAKAKRAAARAEKAAAKKAEKANRPKRVSKVDQMVAILKADKAGVTIETLQEKLGGLLPHTVRAMLSRYNRDNGNVITYDRAKKVYRIG